MSVRKPWSLGPLRLPAEAFEEIEPTFRPRDGKKLRRFRLKGLDLIFTEDPMDTLFEHGEVTPEPMKAPKGDIFFHEWRTPPEKTA